MGRGGTFPSKGKNHIYLLTNYKCDTMIVSAVKGFHLEGSILTHFVHCTCHILRCTLLLREQFLGPY